METTSFRPWTSRSFVIPSFGEPVHLYVGQYLDGDNTAVQIEADDGEPMATLSVNVEGVELAEDEFVFKTYSENEGLLEQLVAAGFVEKTGRSVPVGMAGPQPVCRITFSADEE